MIILAPSGPTQFDIQFMSILLSSVNDLHNQSCFFIAEKSVVDDIKIFSFFYPIFLTCFSIEILVFLWPHGLEKAISLWGEFVPDPVSPSYHISISKPLTHV